MSKITNFAQILVLVATMVQESCLKVLPDIMNDQSYFFRVIIFLKHFRSSAMSLRRYNSSIVLPNCRNSSRSFLIVFLFSVIFSLFCYDFWLEGLHRFLANHAAIPSSRRKEKASKTEKPIRGWLWFSLQP